MTDSEWVEVEVVTIAKPNGEGLFPPIIHDIEDLIAEEEPSRD